MRTTWIAAAIGCALAAATALLWQPEPAPAPNLKPFGGDFWAHRVAYPTMHFSPSWYTDAEREDARVASGVPEGEFAEFLGKSSGSPIALATGAWTFLGPQPKIFGNYGQVTGRINVIAVDPRGPDAQGRHTVYAAADGGGVWKSEDWVWVRVCVGAEGREPCEGVCLFSHSQTLKPSHPQSIKS
jgi:hypothetical protein